MNRKRILKCLIPRPLRRRLILGLEALDWQAARLFSVNGFLASLYYCFFSRRFDHEHRAVLKGRIAYQASLVSPRSSSILLRRNIHRLEKGLIMRPMRPVYAEEYIGETVEAWCRAVNEPSYADSERQWATDVLSRYFDSVGNSPSVDQARARFRALHAQSASPVAVPYAHKTLPQCPVDYDTLRTLFVRRRSVRWFLPKAVEPQLIERAIDAAALAPSACNRQPFRFEVVCDPEQAARMAACANGTAGFSENLPCLMVIVGDLSAYPFERDRHIIYLDGGLVSMQLMLALETLGLGSCPINWPDIPHLEAPLRKALALKPHEQAMMLIAVGYPDPEGGVLYSGKKPCDVLMHACQPDLPPSR